MTLWQRFTGWLAHLKVPIGVADALVVLGVAALFYGCYQVSRPLAWMVLGLIFGSLGMFMILRERRPR